MIKRLDQRVAEDKKHHRESSQITVGAKNTKGMTDENH